MNCDKCGEPLIPNNHFCTNCGAPIKQQVWNTQPPQVVMQQAPGGGYQQVPAAVPQQALVVEDKNKKANTLSLISLLLYLVAPIVLAIMGVLTEMILPGFGQVLTSLIGISRIAAYVLVIVARVQCPSNKFSKILFWIYIIMIALVVILIILFVIFAFVLVMNL